MPRLGERLSLLSLLVAASACSDASTVIQAPNRTLLIVVDGLRPDYVTAELMPNLFALGERGVFGDAHTAAFPSVTRVNSASISTGSYPARHGITHNTMWAPEMGDQPFSTGEAENLFRFAELSGGELVTAPSVGEIMEAAGRRYLVAGSGGSGNSLLQNPRGSSLGIWTAGGFFLPASARDEAIQRVGELPETRSAATAWAVDAYLHHALGDEPPDLTLMWINETDAAGHAHGVGSPEVLEALRSVDRQIGRIVQAHAEHGLADRVNVFVTADHGFTTSTGSFDLGRVVADAGLASDGVIAVGNMIHLRGGATERLTAIVEALQRDAQVGAIYTRPPGDGSREAPARGTVSTAVIAWDHPRSAEILVSPTWTDDASPFGFAGATSRSGVATHGSDSPFDVHIRLVAAGPDLKEGVRSDVPTGNVDLVPTILYLQGITPQSEMDGRVLHELLKDGPEPGSVPVREQIHHAAVTHPDGLRYEMWVEVAEVGSTRYLRGARSQRSR